MGIITLGGKGVEYTFVSYTLFAKRIVTWLDGPVSSSRVVLGIVRLENRVISMAAYRY